MINILILLPFIAGLFILAMPKKIRVITGIVVLLVTLIGLFITIKLFRTTAIISFPWAGFGIDFSLRLDHFSSFIILAVAGFGFLISLYAVTSMKGTEIYNQFFAYLLVSLTLANGAVLADNLIVLLFFWEGLLVTLFGMIYIGHAGAWRTAVKAFVITGVADLCMMAGVALTGYIAHTMRISDIHALPLQGTAAVAAFVFLMIGATAKAGSMPF